jgi:hypothetical protein
MERGHSCPHEHASAKGAVRLRQFERIKAAFVRTRVSALYRSRGRLRQNHTTPELADKTPDITVSVIGEM